MAVLGITLENAGRILSAAQRVPAELHLGSAKCKATKEDTTYSSLILQSLRWQAKNGFLMSAVLHLCTSSLQPNRRSSRDCTSVFFALRVFFRRQWLSIVNFELPEHRQLRPCLLFSFSQSCFFLQPGRWQPGRRPGRDRPGFGRDSGLGDPGYPLEAGGEQVCKESGHPCLCQL